jgi:hypothetical protein
MAQDRRLPQGMKRGRFRIPDGSDAVCPFPGLTLRNCYEGAGLTIIGGAGFIGEIIENTSRIGCGFVIHSGNPAGRNSPI